MIKDIYLNLKKYSFLIEQLIIRDFKVKYKRSVLGVVWSILYPLLMMLVMSIVFSSLFVLDSSRENSLVYLMSGIVVFNYFSEATTSAMSSVLTNFTLINKVYIPKYIFPLSKTIFSAVNFLLTLIPLFAVVFITGESLNIYYLMLPLYLICLFLFTLGVGFILSTVSVYLRDVVYIYGIFIMIWNYLTPIFYPITILPGIVQKLMICNPIYVFLTGIRSILLNGSLPSLEITVLSIVYALVSVLIGSIVFKKNQDNFINYV